MICFNPVVKISSYTLMLRLDTSSTFKLYEKLKKLFLKNRKCFLFWKNLKKLLNLFIIFKHSFFKKKKVHRSSKIFAKYLST